MFGYCLYLQQRTIDNLLNIPDQGIQWFRRRKSIDTFSPRGNNTMNAQPFVVTPKDYDPALNVLGVKVTVLASNTAT